MIVEEHRTDEITSGTPIYDVPRATRTLTPNQMTAIRDAMQLFVEDDIAQGVPPQAIEYCPGCDAPRPLPGFVRYEDAALCNACATEYEIARTGGLVADAATYLRDKADHIAQSR
jgi:hypothetical protein